MADYIDIHLRPVLEILRDEKNHSTENKRTVGSAADFISLRGVDVVHQISGEIDRKYLKDKESQPVTARVLTMEEILNRSSRFRLTKVSDSTSKHNVFGVYSQTRERWFDFPLPDSGKIVHKGGLPRLCLKILAGAPESTIEAELPANDIDIVASGQQQEILKEAERMGVDRQGVEFVDELYPLSEHLINRDVTLNSCLLGKDFLAYTDEAWESARSGKVEAIGGWRGIYGRDTFTYDGMELKKHRALMRLSKMVAEGKALSYLIEPINNQQDFGIYWLVLARKFAKKTDFPELMEKLLYINRQIDQVETDENDILGVLDRIHTQYPQFDFDVGEMDMVGLARWYTRKLAKQAKKIFEDTYGIKSDINFVRQPDDDIPFAVTTNGFEFSGIDRGEFGARWNEFLDRCRERTRQCRLTQTNPGK